ncbi:MAG: hypothetical protein J0M02_19445, partial [Planctomycetes bacterium]|nr:hypothetical protein [Planctomycetota bacterium]
MRTQTFLAILAAATLAASDYASPTPVPPPWDYTVAYPDRSGVVASTTYEVGPGRTYAEPRDVPWLDLQPGDQVLIHYRAEPYRDAILLCARGETTRWITVRGVKGPAGERPVFDGDGARMPSFGLNQWFDGGGMIKIHRPIGMSDSSYRPGYIHVSGFEVRNAKPPAQYTDWSGGAATWSAFSAGIAGQGFDHVAITDCELHGNGQGLFVNSTNGAYFQTWRLLVADNHFHGNGNPASFSEHNAYTEGIGTVYEYNWFGPPADGSYGDNIKERSAGVIFRYNHIEGGADLIALRDPESNVDYESEQLDAWGERLVANAFIYGNTFVTRDYLQSVIGHGDGGMGTLKQPREGSLCFYANRVISTVDNQGFWTSGYYVDPQGVPLFDLLNTRSPTTVVARNNLLYAASRTPGAETAPLALFYWQGIADFQANWANDYIEVYAPVGGTNLATGDRFDGSGLGGLAEQAADPGFVDLAGGDYRLTAESPFRSLDAPLPDEAILRGLTPAAEPVRAPFVRADTPAIPEIAVSRSGSAIAAGGTDVIAGTTVGAGTTLSYRIANIGTAPLSIAAVDAIAGTNCTVAVVAAADASVAASASTTLVLRVTPSAAGAWSFPVSFASGDADEDPMSWSVSGDAVRASSSGSSGGGGQDGGSGSGCG